MDKNKKRASFLFGSQPKDKSDGFSWTDTGTPDDEDNYYASFRDLSRKLKEVNEDFEKLTTKIEEVEKETRTKLDNELDKVKGQIVESKTKVVETLALFAALFTFLSLQVQALKEQTSIDRVVGLVLVCGGIVAFFVLILDIIIKTPDDASTKILKIRFISLLIISLLLVGCGIMFLTVKS